LQSFSINIPSLLSPTLSGAIHGHPWGTKAGVKAMRQSIDRNYGPEYNMAIKQWS
jgi:hypothetical protein